MRIISIHVDKFGTLSDYTLDFTPGLNRILESNGWGKSTLAAFLRVMFYGLEGKGKKKDVKDNDKTYFKPWDGGNFGGSVTFESNGHKYIVSRTFKETGKSTFGLKDADTLIDSHDFTENIGEELFGIDAESFRKTSFIDHDGIKYSGVNSNITSKVSTLSRTGDLNQYDSVETAMNTFLTQKSSERATGVLYKLNNEITGLEREVATLDLLNTEIENHLQSRNEILEKGKKVKAEKERLTNRQKKLLQNKAIAVSYKSYKELKEEIQRREQTVGQLREGFGNDIPSSESISLLSEYNQKAEECKISLKRFSVVEENERYERLKRYFKDAPPKEEELKKQIDACNEMHRLIEENAGLEENIATEKNRCKALEDSRYLKNRSLAEKQETLNKIRSEKEEDDTTQVAEQPLKGTDKKYNVTGIILLVIGFVLVALYFAVFHKLLVLGLAILILVAGLVLFGIGMSVRKKETELQKEAERRLIKDKEKQALLRQQNLLNAGHDVDLLQSEISGMDMQIKESNEKIAAMLGKTEENRAVIKTDEEGIRSFLETFDISYSKSDAEDTLYEMKNRIPEFYALQKEMQEREEKKVLLTGQSTAADDSLMKLYRELGGTGECSYDEIRQFIQKLRISISEYENACRECESAKAKLRAFLTEHPEFATVNTLEKSGANEDAFLLSDADAEAELQKTEAGISEQNSLYEQYSNEYNLLSRNLEDKGKEADRIRDLAGVLEEKKEERDALTERYRVVLMTEEYLKKAKDRFIARYMAPIKTRFDAYMTIMRQGVAVGNDEYMIDADLNILKKEQGEYHDVAWQSEGLSDMVGLCIRLALMDVMFQNEKPLIIMDDPFVNLDEENLAGAKQFLNRVAQNYQILYLTCHQDRM